MWSHAAECIIYGTPLQPCSSLHVINAHLDCKSIIKSIVLTKSLWPEQYVASGRHNGISFQPTTEVNRVP